MGKKHVRLLGQLFIGKIQGKEITYVKYVFYCKFIISGLNVIFSTDGTLSSWNLLQ